MVTISTHKGLFQYKRLCYGVASAPGLFQAEMEKMFIGMEGVLIFSGDILVYGNEIEHQSRLREVLNRLRKKGKTVEKEKCQLWMRSVTFLGFKIDEIGIHILESRTEAITKAPVPKNVSQLKLFLWLINYYGKFIKNQSTILPSLYKFLKIGNKWEWKEE